MSVEHTVQSIEVDTYTVHVGEVQFALVSIATAEALNPLQISTLQAAFASVLGVSFDHLQITRTP